MLFERLLVGSTGSTPPTDVGELFGAGVGTSGQFGRGSTTSIGTPSPWTEVDSSMWEMVVSATGGYDSTNTLADASFSVGIKSNGTLWATGRNTNGNLGQGNTTNLTTWTQIGSDQWIYVAASSVSTISSQARMSCLAVKSDGTLWGWGNNSFYQQGDGTTTQHTSPVQVGVAANWVKVAMAGQNISAGTGGFCLGLTSDGKIWAWGNNVSGSTGQGTTSGNTTVPVQIGTDTDWVDIAAGTDAFLGSAVGLYSLGVKSGGTLWGWGDNSSNQIGPGSSVTTPTQIGVATTWAKVFATSTGTSFAIRTNGALYSWGQATASGLTGLGTTGTTTTTPTQVGSATIWSSVCSSIIVSIGGGYCLAVRTDQTLWGWGANTSNCWGTGSASPSLSSSPLEVGVFPLWKYVSAGGVSGNVTGTVVTSLAIRGVPQDYSVLYTFGTNSYGQTAQGTATGDTLSAKLAASANYTWEKVAPGTGASGQGIGCVGILKNGTLWGWGSNEAGGGGGVATGSCALGSVVLQSTVPVQIGTDTDWVDIAQGTYGGLGIKANGSVWAWGYDIWGQFGSGAPGTILYTPTQIGVATNWAYIATNGVVSFFINTSGQMYTLGSNNGYSTGLNTTVGNTTTLTLVNSDTNWAMVSVSLNGAIAIKTNNQGWSWGTSVHAELCQGAGAISTPVPTQIGAIADFAFVACGSLTQVTFVIKTTGTLWSIGWNDSYQTGRNLNTGDTTSLTQISLATDWVGACVLYDATAGKGSGIAIKSGGEVFCWGNAANGVLGNGATSGTEPVPIPLITAWGSTNAISIAGNSGPGMVISSV